MYKLGLEKIRETREQTATIHWIMEKAREFPKNVYFCFIDYAKAFDCVNHNKLWKILSDQCEEIEENNRMGKTRDLFRSTYQVNTSCKDRHDKGQKQ